MGWFHDLEPNSLVLFALPALSGVPVRLPLLSCDQELYGGSFSLFILSQVPVLHSRLQHLRAGSHCRNTSRVLTWCLFSHTR